MSMEIDVLQLRAAHSHLETLAQERLLNEQFRKESRRYYKLIESLENRISQEDRREFHSFLDRVDVQSLKQIEKLIDGIRVWVNPPNFADAYERSISARQSGTAEWLFDTDSFKRWRYSLKTGHAPDAWDRILWVQG